jgi:hypothetical protein
MDKEKVKEVSDSILSAFGKVIVDNIKYIVVLVLGWFIGVLSTSNMNNISENNVGCLFSCTYAPIYNATPTNKEKREAPKALSVLIRKEDLELIHGFEVKA